MGRESSGKRTHRVRSETAFAGRQVGKSEPKSPSIRFAKASPSRDLSDLQKRAQVAICPIGIKLEGFGRPDRLGRFGRPDRIGRLDRLGRSDRQ